MTRFALALALATTPFAPRAALAQDTATESFRAHCAELEALASPRVIDCMQALTDLEAAATPEEGSAILERYARAESPYDFDRTLADAATGPTPFDQP